MLFELVYADMSPLNAGIPLRGIALILYPSVGAVGNETGDVTGLKKLSEETSETSDRDGTSIELPAMYIFCTLFCMYKGRPSDNCADTGPVSPITNASPSRASPIVVLFIMVIT